MGGSHASALEACTVTDAEARTGPKAAAASSATCMWCRCDLVALVVEGGTRLLLGFVLDKHARLENRTQSRGCLEELFCSSE
jgi:hypothetical protein